MKSLPKTKALQQVAERVIWFEEPEEALENGNRFLAYAMRYGAAKDLKALEEEGITLAAMREALEKAPAGLFDARSWTYWTLKCGYEEVPPLPARRFEEKAA